MIDKGNLVLNLSDDIIQGTVAVHGGEYICGRVKQMLNVN
jgi:hypothetical protein